LSDWSGKLALAQQPIRREIVTIPVVSHDAALWVDAERLCGPRNSSRYIDGGKSAVAQQKTVAEAAALNEEPTMSPCGFIPDASV